MKNKVLKRIRKGSVIKGFSLIELMIVVAIIGVLSAVGYPSFMSHLSKASKSEAQQVLISISQRQAQYFMDAREYAGSLGTDGLNMIIPKNSAYSLSGADSFVCASSTASSCSNDHYTVLLSDGTSSETPVKADIADYNASSPPRFLLRAVPKSTGRNKGELPLEIDSTNKKTGPWK